jgi:hypothetical protein
VGIVEGWAMVVRTAPSLWRTLAVSVFVGIAEALLLVLAFHRWQRQREHVDVARGLDWKSLATMKAPSIWAEIVAAVAPLAVVFDVVHSVHTCRGVILEAVSVRPHDVGERARALSLAIAEEQNVIPMGIFLAALVVALACPAAALATSVRLRVQGFRHASDLANRDPASAAIWVRHPGPRPDLLIAAVASFLVLGLGPVAASAYYASLVRIQAFAALSDLDPSVKISRLHDVLLACRTILEKGFTISCVGVFLATALAAALTWRFSATHSRRRLLGPEQGDLPSSRSKIGAIIRVTAAFVVAGLLFVVALPLHLENREPWPPFGNGGPELLLKTTTPALDGPDPVERAPVLEVIEGGTRVNGQLLPLIQTREALETLRSNAARLWPDVPFNGSVILVCEPQIGSPRLAEAFTIAVRAGYPNATFIFIRNVVARRPLLGTLSRNRTSGANVTLIERPEQSEPGAVVLRLADFQTCAALAERVVDLRQHGMSVAVAVP